MKEKIHYKIIEQCYLDLTKVVRDKNIANYSDLISVYNELECIYFPFDSHFFSLELEKKISNKTRQDLDEFVDRNDVLKFYRAAKMVLNELTKLQMCTEEGRKSLEALSQAISPDSNEEEDSLIVPESKVTPQPTPTTLSNISNQNHSLLFLKKKDEAKTPTPEREKNNDFAQEKIPFKIIKQCYYGLRKIRYVITSYPMLFKACDKIG
jgi:hypothetical protein